MRSKAERKKRRDYFAKLWRVTPHPKLFPFPRLVVTLILAAAQRGFSMLRLRWNPKAPTLQAGREMLVFMAVVVIVYMVIYALEWSWNYVVLSPMIVDSENQEKLKQQADSIAALTEKPQPPNKQKEIRLSFARLMDEGKDLQLRMTTCQDNAEFNGVLGPKMIEWVVSTFNAFVEAGLDTDARAFRDSGERPSPAQVQAEVRDYLQPWKHYSMAQLAVYIAKLQEIIERRNL